MLEYGQAYIERSRAAGDQLRQVLSEEAYQVALSMAPSYEAPSVEPLPSPAKSDGG